MLRSVVIAVCVLLAPLVAFAGPPGEANLWNGAEINWRDARSGIYESSQTGRPVIMVFQATWCAVCKRYRNVFKDPRVVAESKDFVMILVDADKEKMLNGAFSPDGTYVPRTLFLDSDGNVSSKLVGSDPEYPHTIDVDNPDQLLALMKKAHGVFNIQPVETAPVDGSRT